MLLGANVNGWMCFLFLNIIIMRVIGAMCRRGPGRPPGSKLGGALNQELTMASIYDAPYLPHTITKLSDSYLQYTALIELSDQQSKT